MQPDGVKWRQMIGCCPLIKETVQRKNGTCCEFLRKGRGLVDNAWTDGWMNVSWIIDGCIVDG